MENDRVILVHIFKPYSKGLSSSELNLVHRPADIADALVADCEPGDADLIELGSSLKSNASIIAHEHTPASLTDKAIREILSAHDVRGTFSNVAVGNVPIDNGVRAVRMMVENEWSLGNSENGSRGSTGMVLSMLE